MRPTLRQPAIFHKQPTSGMLVACLATAAVALAAADRVDPSLYGALRWRHVGPFRGGRTVGAAGVAQQPDVFYIGVTNGGVWKTTDYALTWTPIFDDQPTQSIGAVAVAPSDPNIVYVGGGEGLRRPDLSVGDGIYKSTDGGTSWELLGDAGGAGGSRARAAAKETIALTDTRYARC